MFLPTLTAVETMVPSREQTVQDFSLRISAKLPLFYLFGGITWMVGGNALLQMTGVNRADLPDLQMVLGGLFLIITSGLLHWLVYHFLADLLHARTQLDHDNRALRTLIRCARAIAQGQSQQAMAAEICRILVEEEGYCLAWVGGTGRNDGSLLRPLAHHGYEAGFLTQVAPIPEPVAPVPERDGSRGQPLVVGRIDQEPVDSPWRKAALEHGYRSCIVLPLGGADASFGMMHVYAAHPEAFGDQEARLLQALAEDLAFGLSALRSREDRDRAEAELQKNRQRLDYLLAHSPAVIFSCFLDDRLTLNYVSDNVVKFLGDTAEELSQGFSFWSRVADGETGLPARVREALLQTGMHTFEHRVTHRNGEGRWLRIRLRVMQAPGAGLPPEAVGCCTDVTEKKRAELQLQLLSRATEQSPASLLITDTEGRIEYVNPTFTSKTGYSLAEIQGQNPRFLKSGLQEPDLYKNLWETINRGQVWQAEIRNRKKNGDCYWVRATITPIRDEAGRITHFVRTAEDVTEQKTAQETINHLAHFDTLTGLPNQNRFSQIFASVLPEAQRQRELAAVLLLELDQFGQINRTFGHEMGNLLLKSVVSRLQRCLGENAVLARLHSNYFGILWSQLTSEQTVITGAKQILELFQQPFNIQFREFFITPSIGIAQFPYDGTAAATLLKNADAALFRARQQGGNNYQFYAPVMSERAKEHMAFETSLRRALERNEFHLHFQPQMDVPAGRMVGVEALLRWQHPLLGKVSPDQFIPLAEKTGLIIPIGEWVIRAACEQSQAWRRAGLGPLRMAINLSPRQFRQPDLVQKVARIVGETGQDPRLLDLEITESALMESVEQTVQTLLALKALGIRICIDDFGTGYSSLSYLKRFPIDVLKIDRSFIMGLPEDGDDAAIINAILAMARNLQLEVIAEGVETEKQMAYLLAQQCIGMQGYHFSSPLPGEDLAVFARQSRSWLGMEKEASAPSAVNGRDEGESRRSRRQLVV